MKKILLALAVAGLAVLAMAATVAAAGPGGVAVRERAQAHARSGDAIPAILGLTTAEIQELHRDGLSLAQIAERQQVDPQELIDALMTRWEARIQARLENGALAPDEATQLRTRLETRARDLVFKVTTGGMQGAAVGAGPNGAANGTADRAANGTAGSGEQTRQRAGAASQNGDGTCDGTGDGRHSGAGNGAGRP